eukprot:scaffold126_cov266-Prasinococcus_capsulatus_cf.AAC.2
MGGGRRGAARCRAHDHAMQPDARPTHPVALKAAAAAAAVPLPFAARDGALRLLLGVPPGVRRVPHDLRQERAVHRQAQQVERQHRGVRAVVDGGEHARLQPPPPPSRPARARARQPPPPRYSPGDMQAATEGPARRAARAAALPRAHVQGNSTALSGVAQRSGRHVAARGLPPAHLEVLERPEQLRRARAAEQEPRREEQRQEEAARSPRGLRLGERVQQHEDHDVCSSGRNPNAHGRLSPLSSDRPCFPSSPRFAQPCRACASAIVAGGRTLHQLEDHFAVRAERQRERPRVGEVHQVDDRLDLRRPPRLSLSVPLSHGSRRSGRKPHLKHLQAEALGAPGVQELQQLWQLKHGAARLQVRAARPLSAAANTHHPPCFQQGRGCVARRTTIP